MTSVAVDLARWACDLEPSAAALALAGRSLADTVAVTLAARDHPVARLAATLPEGARWAVAAHIADIDDRHIEATTRFRALFLRPALAARGGCGRGGSRLPGGRGGHRPARLGAGMAALLRGPARHLHGWCPDQCRR